MKNCRKCGRGMRPKGTSIAAYPGTVRIGSAGTCMHCRAREIRDEREPLPLTVDQLSVLRMVKRRCTSAEIPAVAGMLGVA